jgi:hypothetical protein
MGASRELQQKFPFPYDDVFNGICKVITKLGFELKSYDRVVGIVSASKGISFLTWGENLTITVEKLDEGTLVGIRAAINASPWDLYNINSKNIDKLIESLSKHLQST